MQVSTDDGRSWTDARLEDAPGPHVWRVFHANVTVDRPGRQWVLTRATSKDGETQPMNITQAVLDEQLRQNTAVRTFAALLEVR